MKIKIYANYGPFSADEDGVAANLPLYTHTPDVDAAFSKAVHIDLPDGMVYDPTAAVNPLLVLSGAKYTLSEVLTGIGDCPAIIWWDGDCYHLRPLSIIVGEEAAQ